MEKYIKEYQGKGEELYPPLMSGQRRAKKLPPKIQRGNYVEVQRKRGIRVINYGTPVERLCGEAQSAAPSASASGSQLHSDSLNDDPAHGVNDFDFFDRVLPTPEEVRKSYGRVNRDACFVNALC